jgi:hypothetical protein
MTLVTLLTSRFEGYALLGRWFCIAMARNLQWVGLSEHSCEAKFWKIFEQPLLMASLRLVSNLGPWAFLN